MQFTCNIIHRSQVAHFMSTSIAMIEDRIMILDHTLLENLRVAQQICRVALDPCFLVQFKLNCTKTVPSCDCSH